MAPSASHVATRATHNPVEQLDLFALLAPRIARLGTAPPRLRAPVASGRKTAPAWPFADTLLLAVEAAQKIAQTGALTASVFDAYRPYVRVPGACPHPTRLVESAAMAAATAPSSTYRPMLPEHLVTQGILSDAQLEAVCRAGSAHAEHLPGEGGESGPRQGFFVGDGTRVGRWWRGWRWIKVSRAARVLDRAPVHPVTSPGPPLDAGSRESSAFVSV